MTLKNFIKSSIVFCLVITGVSFKAGDDLCGIKNTSFIAGEFINVKVYYSTLGIYVSGGEATISVTREKLNGKTVFHCVGEGRSFSFFDNFFKVRDRYETYIDSSTMLPVKFIRNVYEGGFRIYNNVTFNHIAGTAVSTHGTFKVPVCVQDILSMIYNCRSINFDKFKPGDKISYDLFLDDEVYHLYIRYIGKEILNTRYGKFHTIKIKPLLVKGTLFQGGEKMAVWVSDDPNHLPLRVESPITVGSIKADMMGYKNLRYPLTSLISPR